MLPIDFGEWTLLIEWREGRLLDGWCRSDTWMDLVLYRGREAAEADQRPLLT